MLAQLGQQVSFKSAVFLTFTFTSQLIQSSHCYVFSSVSFFIEQRTSRKKTVQSKVYNVLYYIHVME